MALIIFGNIHIKHNTVIICRYVNKKNSSVWQDAYQTIIKKVQDTMLVVYGATLKLQDSFKHDV
jgi:hypothetical protein